MALRLKKVGNAIRFQAANNAHSYLTIPEFLTSLKVDDGGTVTFRPGGGKVKDWTGPIDNIENDGVALAGDQDSFDAMIKEFTSTDIADEDAGGSGSVSPDVNQRVSGIDVVWNGGLSFIITPGTYYWNGVLKTFLGDEVTLAPADEDNPRIDVIALLGEDAEADNYSGEPAVDPAEPTVPADEGIRLTAILVNADATEPANVSNDVIVYAENLGSGGGEWNISGTMTRNANATNKVLSGTKSIQVTGATTSQYIEFTIGAGTVNVADVDKLIIPINLTSNLSGGLNITLYNGATNISSVATATQKGLVLTLLNTWQLMVVDIGSLTYNSSVFNKVRIIRTGSGGTINFNLDQIRFQKGATQVIAGDYLPKTFSADQIVNMAVRKLSFMFAQQFLIKGQNTAAAQEGTTFEFLREKITAKVKDAAGEGYQAYVEILPQFVSLDHTDTVDPGNNANVTVGGGAIAMAGRMCNLFYPYVVPEDADYAIPNNASIVLLPSPSGANRQLSFNVAGGDGTFLEIHVMDDSTPYRWDLAGVEIRDANEENFSVLKTKGVYVFRNLLGYWKLVWQSMGMSSAQRGSAVINDTYDVMPYDVSIVCRPCVGSAAINIPSPSGSGRHLFVHGPLSGGDWAVNNSMRMPDGTQNNEILPFTIYHLMDIDTGALWGLQWKLVAAYTYNSL